MVFAIIGPVPQMLGYVAGPLAIARRATRHGWTDGRPSARNLTGIVPLTAGAGMLGWAIASHYDAAPDEMPLTVVPTYLARGGAYGFTRNPMYVGGAAMQIGWAILLGSVPNLAAAALYIAGLGSLGVPFEERLLHTRFGDSYDEYRRSVPRWLPFPGRRG
jgi:protein-S-isoprenylcysteine O-methyltransferase Ste14